MGRRSYKARGVTPTNPNQPLAYASNRLFPKPIAIPRSLLRTSCHQPAPTPTTSLLPVCPWSYASHGNTSYVHIEIGVLTCCIRCSVSQ